MRILFYASYPDLPIGYAKVAYQIATWLADQPDIDLHYFAVGRGEGGCGERAPPAGAKIIDVSTMTTMTTDEFGMDILASTLESLQPDVFLIYNDIIVTCRAFNTLQQYRATHPKTRFISYLDLVYPFEKLALIRHVDRNTDAILVFSECWRRNLVDMGIHTDKVRVFPHGFSADLFKPIPTLEAKAQFGFAADDFILLNINRNTYRKAQDIAIRAFVAFLIRENWDPRIKLFLHCALETSSGYNLLDVLDIEACRAKVPVAWIRDRIRTFQNPHISDTQINLLYNATDIGLNTCMGEGFGHCQLEHAALGKPQIVSKVGALADLFAEGGAILVEPKAWIRASNTLDEHSGDLGICDAADFAAAMSRYFHDRKKREEDGLWGLRVLPERYAWSRVLEVLKQSLL
jgi:glycosyltransferase involved in cell wall biosynthesis